MKALIVFDSLYGNTEQVARAIGLAVGPDTKVVRIADAATEDPGGVDPLIVGSPTQGGRPTKAASAFLSGLGDLSRVRVAAFDTRIDTARRNAALRLLVGMIGYAAPKIAARLKSRGASIAGEPVGFIVEGREGPLRAGEIERATEWARRMAAVTEA